MFLIELSVDGLAHLKKVMRSVPVEGDDITKHAEIMKHLDNPIVGEKLVHDIQQKALQQDAAPQGAPGLPHTPGPVSSPMPTMPGPDAVQAFPMPGGPQ
jgi:hypothetical protein